MQQLARSARILSSPTVLIVTVWSVLLIVVAIGPIDYSNQPSAAVLSIVVVGIALFILAEQAGIWCFRVGFATPAQGPAPRADRLSLVVSISSCAGMAGIGLIALDRIVLSGVSNSSYAELLRCAPDLIDIIQIKRTPLLYVGYALFSFGFASLVLFLLKGEQIRGRAAVLAQLSILSPVGYALLYAGRMPILFVIILTIAAVLVRLAQGQRALPEGHHLVVKMIVLVLVFGMYSSAMWLSRRSFCMQMNGVVRELQHRLQEREAQQRKENAALGAISAADLGKMIGAGPRQQTDHPDDIATLLLTMDQAWHTKPSGYVISAIQSGYFTPWTAVTVLSTYFYLTHGVRILDKTWRERDQLSPHWGVYQIGVLSPILRVFFPQNEELLTLKTELQSAGIHGFFPTVWAAAYIDFGIAGAVIYVLIWGFAAGWSAYGVRHTALATPALLLTFIIATILLSPVQGPLGIANSALVLGSMIIVGLAVDFGGRERTAATPVAG
jgi:hypothetical protein